MASFQMSSSLFLRGSRNVSSALFSTRMCSVAIATPHRQFTSASGPLWNASSNAEGVHRQTVSGPHERKLLAFGIHRRATPQQIESLFNDTGLDVTSITVGLNRFTFGPTNFAVIELSDEQQASRAVDEIKLKKILNKPIHLQHLRSDWEFRHRDFSPMFLFNSRNPDLSLAINPLLENRRVIFKVKAPGWAPLNAKVKARNQQNSDHVVRLLSKYGLEAVSYMGVNWGNISYHPRYLCLVDFSTKEGAEEAIRALHGTEHEGLEIGLKLSKLSPWKAHQIGQWDAKLLSQLKESGLTPPQIFPNRNDASKSEA